MTDTSENIQESTYTNNTDSHIQYGSAKTQAIQCSDHSWTTPAYVRSVSTNRTEGPITLYLASREMFEPNRIGSTE